MFTVGSIAAVAAGAFLHPAHRLISEALVGHGWYWTLGAAILILLTLPALYGAGVGYVVSQASILGKSRREKPAVVIAVLCSLIGFSVYVVIRYKVVGSEVFDSGTGLLKAVSNLLSMTIAAAVMANCGIGRKPFCEACGGYMKKTTSRRLSTEEQAAAQTAAGKRSASAVARYFTGAGFYGDQYAVIEIFHCDRCRGIGFLNIRAFGVKTETEGDDATNLTVGRLVFSSVLTESELAALPLREKGTPEEDIELRRTKAALLIILLGIGVVGRRRAGWPITTWPMYSRRETTFPPSLASAVELRAISRAGEVYRLAPYYLFLRGTAAAGIAQQAIELAFVDGDRQRRKANRAYLTGVVADTLPGVDIAKIQGWRHEWTVEPLAQPPLDRNHPSREFMLGSFDTADYADPKDEP
jgi:hypothetical protein